MTTAGEDTTDSTKRSLVVDEAAFEEQFLRCHICNEKFNQDERHPKSLPCNHTFCLPCLKQVFDHNQQNTRSRTLPTWRDDAFEGVLKCPECRVEIFLCRSEIAALPSDHRVIQMMDFLSGVQAKSQNVCTKHQSQALNFFCKKCLIPVCRDCTVLDHKENQGHVIVDVSDALSDNSDDFNKMDENCKSLLDKMKSRSDCLANASKNLDLIERQLRSTIKDTFIEYRLLLERRQEALIKILHESIKNQKQMIHSRFVDICTQGTELQKIHETFSSARKSSDVKQLFTVQQEMKEKETEFTCTAEANDDELFLTCNFAVDNECQFLSEMSGLGEVTTIENLELKNPVPAHQLVLLDSLENRMPQSQQICDNMGEEDEMSAPQLSSSMRRILRQIGEQVGDDEEEMVVPVPPHRLSSRLRRATIEPREEPEDYTEPEHDTDTVTSAYLTRIASRLNQSANEMAEALLNQTSTESADRNSSDTGHARSSSSSRPRRPNHNNQPVRVVRHPQLHISGSQHGHGYSSATRYSNSSESRRRTPNDNA
ncbi:hypothetical protein KUTeg_024593 [Tegillarca granosa]|uniref:Uncharacterized protein n=1 Tax=Tegillarca granosa TaxID=220873 RepID=A0ABQ9E398_TEGGR|nr:hypothetical protein KUTeg_024593 [Tegillarca granosa]